MTIMVHSLHYYPIKSCRGIDVDSALVTRRGLEFDRTLMLVDRDGNFLTQRELPQMALIATELLPQNCGEMITLRAPASDPFTFLTSNDGRRRQVTLWDSLCDAVDQGDGVASWFSDFLHHPVRLVRIADEFQRELSPRYRLREDDETAFADGYPVLIVSQASLDDLNDRLAQPLPMNRFRPNIVVSGCAAFAEDNWQRIRIGDVEFACVKKCARCKIVTIDQQSAEVGKEPLTTLANYRYFEDRGVMFGQNMIPVTTGAIKVGDQVQFLEESSQ